MTLFDAFMFIPWIGMAIIILLSIGWVIYILGQALYSELGVLGIVLWTMIIWFMLSVIYFYYY